MTIADKYDLKALFNRCDFYIAQALRSCQLTGEDVKVNFRLLQFKAEGRSGYLVEIQCVLNKTYALSFYVTKTVLVGPKWFWSDQIDLDLTLMIWSRPK